MVEVYAEVSGGGEYGLGLFVDVCRWFNNNVASVTICLYLLFFFITIRYWNDGGAP